MNKVIIRLFALCALLMMAQEAIAWHCHWHRWGRYGYRRAPFVRVGIRPYWYW
ncbi:hypothetical protein M1466_01015 [Candidatus Dependentiae bacterium]|nr:hypothetical protein [Candidatus Dependentiae bacterium]